MAPSKRAAAPATRGAKVAKKEDATKQATSAEQQGEACPEPVVAILDKLTATAAEPVVAMMRAAMPFIVSSKPEERHTYQVGVMEMWDALVKDADAKLVSDIEAADAQHSTIAAERAARDDKLQQARDVESALLSQKEDAAATCRELDSARVAAAEAAAAQKELLGEADALLQAKVDARGSYAQALTETWEPLKAGSFAGSDWRLKNKAIERLSSLLAMADPPAALAASLPVALKERLNARGPFTLHVIEAGEAAFQAQLQLLQSQEDELREAHSAQLEALAKADDAASAKVKEHETAEQASIDAQNAWVDANSVVFGLVNTDIEQREAAAAAALEEARGILDGFRGRVAAYELLVNPPSSPVVASTAVQMSDVAVTEGDVVMAAEPAAGVEVATATTACAEIPTDPIPPKVIEETPDLLSTTGAACGA